MPDSTVQTMSHFPACPSPVKLPLVTLPEHPCPYLPARTARSRAFLADQLPAGLYHRLMDAGFRRSGNLFYQPTCHRCRDCVPIRVVVDRFIPGKSQRRCLRRNRDLRICLGRPEPTAEKFKLYRRYAMARHDRSDESWDDFVEFLYTSPVNTLEFTYRTGDRDLLAVGICDVSNHSLSTVYFYFDPDQTRRGLGTFGVLTEIEYARRLQIPHYYLGYWISSCRSMRYKVDYRPAEILDTDGIWRDISASHQGACRWLDPSN